MGPRPSINRTGQSIRGRLRPFHTLRTCAHRLSIQIGFGLHASSNSWMPCTYTRLDHRAGARLWERASGFESLCGLRQLLSFTSVARALESLLCNLRLDTHPRRLRATISQTGWEAHSRPCNSTMAVCTSMWLAAMSRSRHRTPCTQLFKRIISRIHWDCLRTNRLLRKIPLKAPGQTSLLAAGDHVR